MILVRSPLRISIGGGGTDLPSYYSQREGFVISAAIDSYIYIAVHDTFEDDFIIKYSQLERAASIDEIRHPLVREALTMVGADERRLEISSFADLPAGTGLGSSGAFTTGLLRALHAHQRNLVTNETLAEEACEIEINRLGEPVGKQDQYISALGGITCMTFKEDGRVESEPLKLAPATLHTLEDHLCLFFTGYSRSASDVLKDQDDRTKGDDKEMLDNLDGIKAMGYRIKDVLEHGRLSEFADIMDEHWQKKRARSTGMTNEQIDQWYALGRSTGARGGKLVGAGGGGFLLFYADDPLSLRRSMASAGLREVRFRFDYEGTKVLVQ